MKTFKTLAVICILFAAITSLHADDKIKIELKQPPPNQLGVGDMWNLTLENTTKSDIKIYLTGTATEEKDGLIIEGKSKVFTLKPGRTNYKYNDFSSAEVKYNNGKYKEIILRTGNAPEGSYTICVTAFDENGTEVGKENCISQTVQQMGSITLLTPGDDEEIDPQMPIMFTWTPLPKGGPYSLRIVELKGSESKEEGIRANRPIIDKEKISISSYQLGSTDPKLEAGKKYAWQVKSGDVESEVFTFSARSSCFTLEILDSIKCNPENTNEHLLKIIFHNSGTLTGCIMTINSVTIPGFTFTPAISSPIIINPGTSYTYNGTLTGNASSGIIYTDATSSDNSNSIRENQFQLSNCAGCDSCGNGPIWYFGNKAGLDFRTNPPIPLSISSMITEEGCAIISDHTGFVRFYTDGRIVYDHNDAPMPNGTGLNGHTSTTNSAFIVPWPGNCDRYYIFTAGYQSDGLNGPGLQYSIVDMSLNGGLGDIIQGQKNIPLLQPSSEKLAAIKNPDGDYWLIAHGAGPVNGGNFYIYKITSSGLNITPNEIPIGYTHNGGLGFMGGQMKISPDGKKIALVVYHTPIVQVFDFDNINGSINNLLLTLNAGDDRLYGLEFSPNSKLLYVSRVRQNFNSIYRISLNSFNPGANITDLTTPQPGIDRIFNLDPSALEHIGALQLAPNGVIYVAKYPWAQNPGNGTNLGQITDPNSITSTYDDNGPDLLPNTRSGLGLPGTIICPTANTQEPVTCVTPPTGMVGWWDFDETTGSTANDRAGYNNQGAYISSPVQTTSGKVLGALNFTGTNYVNVPNHSEFDFGKGDFAIDAWINRSNDKPYIFTILDKRTSLGDPGYCLFLYNNHLCFQINGVNYSSPATSPSILSGSWHHIAVSVKRSGTNSSLEFYIDGILIHTVNGIDMNTVNNTGPLVIGTRFDMADRFKGTIDEVEIFNRALNGEEILSIFKADSFGKCKVPITTGCNCGGWEGKKGITIHGFIENLIDEVETLLPCDTTYSGIFVGGGLDLLSPNYNCSGNNCNVSYNWQITSPANIVSTFNTFVIHSFPFNESGTYSVKLIVSCGEKVCDSCTIYIKVRKKDEPCKCNDNSWGSIPYSINGVPQTPINCNDPVKIINVPSPTTSISFNPDATTYRCSPADCIPTFNWRINNISQPSGPTLDLTGFAGAGDYNIEVTPVCGSNNCIPCIIIIKVSDEQPCGCGKWDKKGDIVYVKGKENTKETVHEELVCDRTYENVISGEEIKLGMSYHCKPVCSALYDYKLIDIYGTEVLSGTNVTMPFTFIPHTTGSNKLLLIPKCGTNVCDTCKILFEFSGTDKCDCKSGKWDLQKSRISYETDELKKDQPLKCDDTYFVNKNSSVTLDPRYTCPKECGTSSYSYKINGGTMSPPQITPFVVANINNTTEVLIYTWCGDKICDSCTVNIKVNDKPKGCLKIVWDSTWCLETFQSKKKFGFSIKIDNLTGSTCALWTGSINPGILSTIAGIGGQSILPGITQINGEFSGMPNQQVLNPLCMRFYAIKNGDTCTYDHCFDLPKCNDQGCNCGSWEVKTVSYDGPWLDAVKNDSFAIKKKLDFLTKKVECGNSVQVSKGTYKITMPAYSCQPAGCGATYSWTLSYLGTPIEGMQGNNSYFEYNFQNYGNYTLKYYAYCDGNKVCDSCIVTFLLPNPNPFWGYLTQPGVLSGENDPINISLNKAREKLSETEFGKRIEIWYEMLNSTDWSDKILNDNNNLSQVKNLIEIGRRVTINGEKLSKDDIPIIENSLLLLEKIGVPAPGNLVNDVVKVIKSSEGLAWDEIINKIAEIKGND